MLAIADQIRRVAAREVPVAIFGESGTGKELVARAIHEGSHRRHGPFVAVSCATIPDAIHEGELFGHERGAFAGAMELHRGRLEQAHGGTLFLDELGDLSPRTQACLLGFLQEKTVRRVGGSRDIPVDVRVVSATHRDLRREVAAGRFREDLLSRLSVYPVEIPPLRDRLGDVPALVDHFVRRFGDPAAGVSPEALAALGRYPYPGNVRELQNMIRRALVTSARGVIEVEDLPREVRRASAARTAPPRPAPGSMSLRAMESQAIQGALAAAGGSVTKAAKLLGIGRATLYRRLAGDPSWRQRGMR